MKSSISLMCICLWLFISCSATKEPAVKQYTIEQFLNTTSLFGSSFSVDGSKILFTSDASGIYNIYTISVNGGNPEQITHSDSTSIFGISYFPNDDRILFRSDNNGDEIWQIYLREPGGDVRNLTPTAGARSIFLGWNPDYQSFYYSSNARDKRLMDVYEMDIESFQDKVVFQNDQAYQVGKPSPDGRYIPLTRTITRNNSEMYLYDLEKDTRHHLSPHEGDINFFPEGFSNDSKSLYYLTDEGSEFQYLRRYDIESGNSETVDKTNWDIMYSYLSKGEKYRVLGINRDARTLIKIYDMESNQAVELPRMPDGDISSVRISRDEKWMAFYVNGSRSPRNLYIYNFKHKKYKQLTQSLNKDIRPEDLSEASVIRYKSFDGLEIPSLLYLPVNYDENTLYPALVWVHGGPGGQSRYGYNELIQYLVNHGYVVLAVNNRGSSGYGKTFYQLDDKRHGKEDLADCIAGKKYLIKQGYAHPSKVGIIGGSYGGFMVLAALAFQPEEFAAGVDIFGVSNWLRTIESIPPHWEAIREALYKELGHPVEERDYLIEISPLFHADRIRKPLMVLQGAQDPRVLQAESDEIVAAVRKNGVPVDYILFEDEGHGFAKKSNRADGYKRILEFCNRYLAMNDENAGAVAQE